MTDTKDLISTFTDLQIKLSKTQIAESNITKFSSLLNSLVGINHHYLLKGLSFMTLLASWRINHRPLLLDHVNCTFGKLDDLPLDDFKANYLQIIEDDLSVTDHKLFEKAGYFTSFLETINNIEDKNLAVYRGNTLSISKPFGTEGKSILLTPILANNAMVYIPHDKPRKLYSEFDPEESAETYIREMYGCSGKYYAHYTAFLDCRYKYPTQRHLLVF